MAVAATRDPFWIATHESAAATERAIDLAIRKEVRELQRRGFGELERRLRAGRGVRAVAALDWRSFESEVADVLEERMLRSARAAARFAADRVNDVIPEAAIAREVQRQARDAASIVAKNTREGLKAAIREARRAGFTPRQVRDMTRSMVGMTRVQAAALVRRTADAVKDGRMLMGAAQRSVAKTATARLVARTKNIAQMEALRSAQEGMDQVMLAAEAAGRVREAEKGWVTRKDGNQDPICDRLHGQRVPIKKRFKDPDTGKTYSGPPAPHNRCRCGVHYFFRRRKTRAATDGVGFYLQLVESFVGVEVRTGERPWLGIAVEQKLGVPAEEIPALLESTGLSENELARHLRAAHAKHDQKSHGRGGGASAKGDKGAKGGGSSADFLGARIIREDEHLAVASKHSGMGNSNRDTLSDELDVIDDAVLPKEFMK